MLEFVYTPLFERTRGDLLTDEEVWQIEDKLLELPDAGDVMEGTGGVRKLRIALHGRGKRGSARLIYLHVRVRQTIYLIMAFAKNAQANLTDEQRKVVRQIAEAIRKVRG
jgi:hypothetical protein